MQYRRIGRDVEPDHEERKELNVEKLVKSFERLRAWDVITPVKLVVFPENLLSHGGRDISQAEKVKLIVKQLKNSKNQKYL